MAAKFSIPSSVKNIFLLSFTSITVLTYLVLSAIIASAHEDQSHHGQSGSQSVGQSVGQSWEFSPLEGKVVSKQLFEGEFLVELEIKNNGPDAVQLHYISIDDQLIADLHRSISSGAAIWLTETKAIAVPVNYAKSNFLSIGVDVEGQDRQYINLIMN